MSKQRQQGQDDNNIKLNLVMHHSFWQRMQPEKENTCAQYYADQNKSQHNKKDVCFTRSRNEHGQMMSG